jgi:hypothetical protein
MSAYDSGHSWVLLRSLVAAGFSACLSPAYAKMGENFWRNRREDWRAAVIVCLTNRRGGLEMSRLDQIRMTRRQSRVEQMVQQGGWP